MFKKPDLEKRKMDMLYYYNVEIHESFNSLNDVQKRWRKLKNWA